MPQPSLRSRRRDWVSIGLRNILSRKTCINCSYVTDLSSNPKDYNDNEDARPYDPRLRGPVRDIELQIDPETGMKNYIAHGRADWATSAAFVKYSFEQSIHHGRMYTAGHSFSKSKDEDLAEALRLLGQGLHTLEDFGAHTNYVELALIEMGLHNVFPHVGTNTMINLRGKHVYPLTTGTFGTVDFYHSVLGEATDHFTQSEVNEMDNALGTAETAAQSSNPLTTLIKLLSKVPGTRDLCDEASRLQAASQAQSRTNAQGGFAGGSRAVGDDYTSSRAGAGDWNQGQQQSQQIYGQGYNQPTWQQPQHSYGDQQQNQYQDANNAYPGGQHDWNQSGQQQQYPSSQSTQQSQLAPQSTQQPQVSNSATPAALQNFDPAKTMAQIYPILVFRDKVVRTISSIIEKIPGLEALVERIVETLTVFILSLLAPFVRPILNAITKSLQTGSEGVISSSKNHQYEVWTNPHSSDPTHSMLSKDHFSNLLNEPAGNVAAEILKFIAPRVLYAWEHPNVPVQQVLNDVEVIFHHPAIRNEHVEVHKTMFKAVGDWLHSRRGGDLNQILSSESVRAGKNHKANVNEHAAVQHNVPSQQHMQSAASGQHAQGLGGFNLGGASSFLGGGGQQQQHGSQQGGQHSSNPLGSIGDFVGNFTGGGGQHGGQQQQHHQQQQQQGGGFGDFIGSFAGGGQHGGQQSHQQQQGGGGGLGGLLNVAGKLGVPGASQLNKYSKYSSMLGGKRELDDTQGGMSRGLEAEIGGGEELAEAYRHAEYNQGNSGIPRSPSPMPLAAPPGYEQYAQSGGQEYFPSEGGYQAQGGYGAQQGGYGGQQEGYGGGEQGYYQR